MSDYKSPVPSNQGSTKLSEISMDTETSLFQSPVHDSALRVVDQLVKVTSDLLRRQSFFLRSEGEIYWDGSKINLNQSGLANNMIFEILQTENASQPKISIKILGETDVSTETTFKSISLDDGELLYLELDPEIVKTSGVNLIIENAIDGGSLISGKTLRKVALTAGMPTIINAVDQAPNSTPATTTYYIPLAYRSGSNINWVPHGIVWPAGTSSLLGSVIVEGLNVYPEKFAENQLQFQSALTDLSSAGGGVLLLTDSFSIDASVTIPENVKILGRGKKTVLTLDGSVSLNLSKNCELQDFTVKTSASFSGDAIYFGGQRAKATNMVIDLSSSPDQQNSIGWNVNAVDGAKFNSTVYTFATQSDGKTLVGGDFTSYGGTINRNRLVRLNSDGTLDTAFCTAVDGNKFGGSVFAIAVQSDGKILVGGNFTAYAGTAGRNYLVRLNSDGTVDTAFMTNAVDGNKFGSSGHSINAITIQSDGKILIGGYFVTYAGTANRNHLIRLNSDGTVDATFCTNASDGAKFSSSVFSITVQPNSEILVGGNFYNYVTLGRHCLVRLSSAGLLDTAFCANAVDGEKILNYVKKIVVQADNKILIGGNFANYGGTVGRNRLVRLNSDGTVDTAFMTNAVDGNKFESTVHSIALQSDGKILVGGNFDNYSLVTDRNCLVRLNSDGTVDAAFCANAVDGNKFNFDVLTIAVQSDGKILVGGMFYHYGIVNRMFLIKLLSSGLTEEGTSAINVTGIKIEANNCRIYESWIVGVTSAAQRIGINYVAGYVDNADVDTLWE